MRILKPLKPNYVNKKNVYGFDVETYQVPRSEYIEQKFLMGSVIGEGVKRVFFDKKEMAEFMTSSRRLRDNIILATNLEFDFMHVFQKTEQIKTMKLIDRHGLISAKYTKGKHNFQFLDSLNYIQASVENLGKMINLPKFKHPKCFKRKPKTAEEREELIKYNIRDSLITQKTGEIVQDFCNYIGSKYKMTIASIGLDNWRRNYQTVPLFQPKKYVIKEHYNAYHGGRTEMFKRGLMKKAYYYDYNSHYPSCCHDGVDGKGSYPFPNSIKYVKDPSKIVLEYEGMSEIEITTPENIYIGVLGIYYNDKYIFPTGTFKGWFTHIELKRALELGYTINKMFFSIYFTKNFIPFRDCIKDLYKLRREYKEQKNDPMQKMVKTLMNGGIYGKFAQKIDKFTEMYHINDLHADEEGRLYTIKNNKKRTVADFIERDEFIYAKMRHDRIPLFVNPSLSIYTTALARLKLFDEMIKHPKQIIYCDTDSLVVKDPLYDDSKKLGELKLEETLKEVVFVRPKFYYLQTDLNKEIIKSKGVRKIKNRNDFNKILDEGIVSLQRFTKIKESAIRKMPFSSIINVDKRLSLEDNKRIWNNKFSRYIEQDSKPLLIV